MCPTPRPRAIALHGELIAPGDAVLVKGSNAVGLAARRRRRWPAGRTDAVSGSPSSSAFPGVLNLIRYITFRAGAAVATALLIGLIIGPRFIGWLRVRQGKGQPIRDDGPQTPPRQARHADDGRADDPDLR